MDERLLDLYNTELRHIRESAAEFARDYPKIAGRLQLSLDPNVKCDDPYVERLLEGFAFLAARVHLKLDAEFPRFTQGLLETVYPDYLCPVPAMAILKFEPDEQDAALAAGVTVPRGTLLRSQLARGERSACTFSTAHDLRLLPLTITQARYFTRDLAELNLAGDTATRAALRLRLRKTIPNSFREIRADPLVVYIHGADERPGQLYEQIFGHKTSLVVQSPAAPKKVIISLGATSIRRVGFSPEQALLPSAPRGFDGYRLLREYFAFPQRFLFFELSGFQNALQQVTGDEVDLIIGLTGRTCAWRGKVDKSSF
ncbi:MAG: type VI secretion system baseplate subunit TssF [Verrucomicrobiota bacterium]